MFTQGGQNQPGQTSKKSGEDDSTAAKIAKKSW